MHSLEINDKVLEFPKTKNNFDAVVELYKVLERIKGKEIIFGEVYGGLKLPTNNSPAIRVIVPLADWEELQEDRSIMRIL